MKQDTSEVRSDVWLRTGRPTKQDKISLVARRQVCLVGILFDMASATAASDKLAWAFKMLSVLRPVDCAY